MSIPNQNLPARLYEAFELTDVQAVAFHHIQLKQSGRVVANAIHAIRRPGWHNGQNQSFCFERFNERFLLCRRLIKCETQHPCPGTPKFEMFLLPGKFIMLHPVTAAGERPTRQSSHEQCPYSCSLSMTNVRGCIC